MNLMLTNNEVRNDTITTTTNEKQMQTNFKRLNQVYSFKPLCYRMLKDTKNQHEWGTPNGVKFQLRKFIQYRLYF